MAVDSVSAAPVQQIAGAIRRAAQSIGVSFQYLLTTAQIESNLNPKAQASTSSAKGLYQFIDQTWLATMKGAGAQSGYGRLADAISRGSDGRYEVADPNMRSEIMKLRADPSASAAMAASFTRKNAEQLEGALGRAPSEGELYIAHFLGSDGAAKLITAAANQPRTNAVALFPQAAAANPSIFYDSFGRPRAAAEVYGKLTGRFELARAVHFAPGQRNSPDTAGVTQALAAANPVPASSPPDTRPLFRSMFTEPVRNGVTQTVSSLWAPAKNGASTVQPVRPLDLFTDGTGDPRKLFGAG